MCSTLLFSYLGTAFDAVKMKNEEWISMNIFPMFGLNQGLVWGKLSAKLNLMEEEIPQSQGIDLRF